MHGNRARAPCVKSTSARPTTTATPVLYLRAPAQSAHRSRSSKETPASGPSSREFTTPHRGPLCRSRRTSRVSPAVTSASTTSLPPAVFQKPRRRVPPAPSPCHRPHPKCRARSTAPDCPAAEQSNPGPPGNRPVGRRKIHLSQGRSNPHRPQPPRRQHSRAAAPRKHRAPLCRRSASRYKLPQKSIGNTRNASRFNPSANPCRNANNRPKPSSANSARKPPAPHHSNSA